MTDAEREEIYVRGLLQVVYNYANTFGLDRDTVKQIAREKGVPGLTRQNYIDVRRAIRERRNAKSEQLSVSPTIGESPKILRRRRSK